MQQHRSDRWRACLAALAVTCALLAAPLGLPAQPLPNFPTVGELIDKQKSSITDRCPLGYHFRDKKLVCVPFPTPGSGGSGGGNITTPFGATRTVGYLEQEVTTVSGQASVATTATIPAGALVERCLVRTTATVPGGYDVGNAGATDLYGADISGAVESTNDADGTFPGGHPVYTATAIMVTAAAGTFSSSTGKVRIFCTYQTYGAPGMD